MDPEDDWLPPLLCLNDFGGDWNVYVDEVYSIFRRDFIDDQPWHDGQLVKCRRDPIYDGKEAGFWHCTSEGDNEEERIPDLRRCERIAWVRAVIEHRSDPRVESWILEKKGDFRHYLWFEESYLIVLAARRKYFQFITAFCTSQARYRTTLRRERDGCQ